MNWPFPPNLTSPVLGSTEKCPIRILFIRIEEPTLIHRWMPLSATPLGTVCRTLKIAPSTSDHRVMKPTFLSTYLIQSPFHKGLNHYEKLPVRHRRCQDTNNAFQGTPPKTYECSNRIAHATAGRPVCQTGNCNKPMQCLYVTIIRLSLIREQ